MALETGTFISDLVVTNPTGSDALAFADDHLRLVKSTLKNTFPNVSGAITKTHTQINNAVDRGGDTMTGALSLSGAPSSSNHATTKIYVDSADQGAISTAVSQAAVAAAAAHPTKTGTGASGTWNINISGSATSATNATNATNAATVTTVTTSQVLNATAGAAAGGVGTYVFAIKDYLSGDMAFGDTCSGSQLQPASINNSGTVSGNGVPLTGTWRCLGYVSGTYMRTLFQRIS